MAKLKIEYNKALRIDKIDSKRALLIDIPKNPKKRDGKLKQYLEDSIKVMKDKGMDINRVNLRALGYGATSITQYFKDNGIISIRGRKKKK